MSPRPSMRMRLPSGPPSPPAPAPRNPMYNGQSPPPAGAYKPHNVKPGFMGQSAQPPAQWAGAPTGYPQQLASQLHGHAPQPQQHQFHYQHFPQPQNPYSPQIVPPQQPNHAYGRPGQAPPQAFPFAMSYPQNQQSYLDQQNLYGHNGYIQQAGPVLLQHQNQYGGYNASSGQPAQALYHQQQQRPSPSPMPQPMYGHQQFMQQQHQVYQRPAAPPLPAIGVESDIAERVFRDAAQGRTCLDITTFANAIMGLGVARFGYHVCLSLYEEADEDKSGHINLVEFKKIVPCVLAQAAYSRAKREHGGFEFKTLSSALESLGLKRSYDEVIRLFEAGDEDKDYKIRFAEFYSILRRVAHDEQVSFETMLSSFKKAVGDSTYGSSFECVSERDASEAFARVARGRGQIDLCSFVSALEGLDVQMDASHNYILSLFAKADKDKSGSIDRREFLDIFRKAAREARSDRLKRTMKVAEDIQTLQ